MTDFLKALRAEVTAIDQQIDAYEKVAILLPPLRKKKQQLEALASTYAVDLVDEDEQDQEETSEVEPRDPPTFDEAKAAVAPVTEADKAVVATIRPAPEAQGARAANPDELFRPAPKPQPAVQPAPVHKPANNGAGLSALQRSQILAERDGIKASLFPAQIVGPKGAPMDCTDLQASIVAVLLRVMPSMLDDNALITQAYRLAGKKTTTGSMSMLAFEVRDLNLKLVSRGIEIVTTKGIGRAIKVLD